MIDDKNAPFPFASFDPEADIEISKRNLPHWYQIGVAIFVTFRTNDSLPRDVLLRMESELKQWLSSNHLPLDLARTNTCKRSQEHRQLVDQLDSKQRIEFKKLSDRLFHRSLDECHGACLLKEPSLARFVAEALKKFDGERYDLDSFVVMPNHVHAIVQFHPGYQLDTVSQSWMRFTAREINRQIDRKGVFWQPEAFDHIVRSAEQFRYLHRYIAENPQKANLSAGEFFYWSRPM